MGRVGSGDDLSFVVSLCLLHSYCIYCDNNNNKSFG